MHEARPLTVDERRELERRVVHWRSIAQPVGPMHGYWDQIFDGEAALNGRPSILTVDQLLSIEPEPPKA